MAWIEPKTDWVAGDGVKASDMNRIERNTEHLRYKSIYPHTYSYLLQRPEDRQQAGRYNAFGFVRVKTSNLKLFNWQVTQQESGSYFSSAPSGHTWSLYIHIVENDGDMGYTYVSAMQSSGVLYIEGAITTGRVILFNDNSEQSMSLYEGEEKFIKLAYGIHRIKSNPSARDDFVNRAVDINLSRGYN